MSSTPDMETTEDVCPHLGLAEDADSHATYATDAHRCYRLEKPTRIANNHQERFCLVSHYTECPIYKGEGISATLAAGSTAAAATQAPRPSTGGTAQLARPGAPQPNRPSPERPRPPSLGPRPRPGGISMRNLTLGIFALAAVVLGFSFWLLTRGDDGDDLPTNPTGESTETSTATTTPATTTTPGTPGATPATSTPGAGTPTSPPGSGGTYVVAEGDTCFGIADANGVTLEDFLAANPEIDADCTNLQVGQEVNIP